MAKAHVDPAELRRFARELHRFNGQLQGMLDTLKARSQHLANTWRDQEQQKFAAELEQTTKRLQQFLLASEDHSRFLVGKATRIESYLGR